MAEHRLVHHSPCQFSKKNDELPRSAEQCISVKLSYLQERTVLSNRTSRYDTGMCHPVYSRASIMPAQRHHRYIQS